MLIINEQDITDLVEINELVDVMEASFLMYEKGEYLMPNRMHVHAGDNTLLLMPCFAGSVFSTKLVSVFPGNVEKQMPIIQGTVMFNDGETGEPLALLNGPKLTAMRTAAVSSVGIRYLSSEDSEVLGIIGAGVQGFHQALFACSQSPVKQILVFSRRQISNDLFIKRLQPLLPDVTIIKAKSIDQLVDESQLIITSTTAEDPVLPDDERLFSDKCIIGVGSFKPTMREFSKALFGAVKQVFIDTEFAVKESGDLAIPLKHGWLKKKQVQPLSSLISGKVKLEPGRTKCFKSVGIALFDLVAAELIYKNALEKGVGTSIEL